MEIKKIGYEFSVCKVEDFSQVNLDAEFSFLGKTDEEKSLVCISSVKCDRAGRWLESFSYSGRAGLRVNRDFI